MTEEHLVPPGERRERAPERRTRVLRGLLVGSFRPRRRGPRRAGERGVSSVDWHHPQWLAVALIIVLCSCVDAFLTLVLVNRQVAEEGNPLMAPLIGIAGMTFPLVKISLTAGGVLLLTQLARLRAFGRVPVGVFLYAVLVIYATLIVYEVGLLDRS
ncbi:MAG: hypothetical protein JSR36_15035 [Proteobacteria bacterium]|nr:hypothetical protein [Pseudomonadota bacterium]